VDGQPIGGPPEWLPGGGTGTVRVLGLDPRRDGAELRQRVGVQLQESQAAAVGEAYRHRLLT
jgi:hypothetical protein